MWLGNDESPHQPGTPWHTGEKIVGYSAVDNMNVTNHGNYAVEYALTVNVPNPWSGYSKIDTIYYDPLHRDDEPWFYCHFVGKVNNTLRATSLTNQYINNKTKGWVLDKRSPGSYSLSTMVCPGSNHPMGLIFVSDN